MSKQQQHWELLPCRHAGWLPRDWTDLGSTTGSHISDSEQVSETSGPDDLIPFIHHSFIHQAQTGPSLLCELQCPPVGSRGCMWWWSTGKGAEHGRILTQTLPLPFLNRVHPHRASGEAPGWPGMLAPDRNAPSLGQTPWVHIRAPPPVGSLGQLGSFPGLHFLVCKMRVLIITFSIS